MKSLFQSIHELWSNWPLPTYHKDFKTNIKTFVSRSDGTTWTTLVRSRFQCLSCSCTKSTETDTYLQPAVPCLVVWILLCISTWLRTTRILSSPNPNSRFLLATHWHDGEQRDLTYRILGSSECICTGTIRNSWLSGCTVNDVAWAECPTITNHSSSLMADGVWRVRQNLHVHLIHDANMVKAPTNVDVSQGKMLAIKEGLSLASSIPPTCTMRRLVSNMANSRSSQCWSPASTNTRSWAQWS